jgi:hypothetical protein
MALFPPQRGGNCKSELGFGGMPKAMIVMPGLVPGIHVLHFRKPETWMAGT